ncbi:hypothetical protein ACFOY4_00070 [Actinomadura syzygii]|uniref:Uncharacterized protein n=1 Tax=Actinomadura syzygii TaxID=1427538 RepID=A0A5D0TR14_9ACTN|nr:hypothetical protein [Actinomadura syzygii]TYC08113.1 hypothetical protein FXF65_40340 [Actinomadura syzygii]
MEVELAMSLRPLDGGPQPPDKVTISVGALLVTIIMIMVAYMVHRDPSLAAPITTACAVGALLVIVLAVSP